MTRPFLFFSLIVSAAAVGGGAWLMHRLDASRLAELKQVRAEERADAAIEVQQFKDAALAYGNAFTRAQDDLDEARRKNQEEIRHAIQKKTTGRPCLNAATLRVLDAAPGLHSPVGVAATHNGNDGAEPIVAAAATDEDEASDTDIADWISTAAGYYQRCSERFDKLAAWCRNPSGKAVKE